MRVIRTILCEQPDSQRIVAHGLQVKNHIQNDLIRAAFEAAEESIPLNTAQPANQGVESVLCHGFRNDRPRGIFLTQRAVSQHQNDRRKGVHAVVA